MITFMPVESSLTKERGVLDCHEFRMSLFNVSHRFTGFQGFSASVSFGKLPVPKAAKRGPGLDFSQDLIIRHGHGAESEASFR